MTDSIDQDEPIVFLIIGRVWQEDDAAEEDAIVIHALVTAPDDDGAVRRTLEALAGQGYAQAELDQIGALEEEPDDPTYDGAYEDALEGNVAIVTFHS